MSDLTTIIARIDALQAAVQTMTNALAAKADKTNKTLDPANKDGLQAAVQAMANSLAGKADQSNWRLEQIKPDIDTIGCKVMVILQAVGVQMDPETGLYRAAATSTRSTTWGRTVAPQHSMIPLPKYEPGQSVRESDRCRAGLRPAAP